MKTNNKKVSTKKVASKSKKTVKKVTPKKQEPTLESSINKAQTSEIKEETQTLNDVSTDNKEEIKETSETKIAAPQKIQTRKKNEIDASELEKEEIIDKVAKNTTKAIEKAIDDNKDVRTGKPNAKEKLILFISSLVSTLAIFAFMFIPLSKSISPLDFFNKDFSKLDTNGIFSVFIFTTFLLVLIIDIYLILNVLMHYKTDKYLEKVNRIFNLNFAISLIYGFISIALFIIGIVNKTGEPTFGIILTAIEILVLIFNATIKSYFIKDYVFVDEKTQIDENNNERAVGEIKSFKRPFPSGELLVYVFIFAALPIVSLFLNLFTITATTTDGSTVVLAPSIKGIDFLLKAGKFENMGNQIVLFAMIILIAADAILLISSFLLFFAKRNNFYKIACSSLVFNFTFVMFITLYGLYYKIIVAADIELMLNWLSDFYSKELIAVIKSTKVDTQTYYLAFASIALLVFVLVRNPSRHALTYEQLDEQEVMKMKFSAPKVCEETVNDFISDNDLLNLNGNGGVAQTDEENPLDVNLVKPKHDEEKYLEKFDACPALSEIDNKEIEYKKELEVREKSLFNDVTLPSLIKFIVNYAKNSRLHLSYSKEDIAAFVAGLGCTRLTILQGMSGTGKTSLPKIFMEAINGNCELIEIESSWREKNELLGFYNEFSKIYTPKKFTQCLYKASLNPDVITFIVLDEMNLSRIEYYFSDFLSLMENEEAFRKIKLSNVKLYNIFDGKRHSYKKLEEDHTLKVPTNVWFIGTANRDESTFEISDKVYDRAHTMNFNKRAPAIVEFSDPMNQRFLKYKELNKLFVNAIKSYKFDIEQNAIIKRVEELLAPFNISFGNRIYKQINEFVRIYCSCFDTPSAHEFDAVETILLTKVVMKLENKNIDNREFLINEFKKLKLTRCVDFISKLSEDF